MDYIHTIELDYLHFQKEPFLMSYLFENNQFFPFQLLRRHQMGIDEKRFFYVEQQPTFDNLR